MRGCQTLVRPLRDRQIVGDVGSYKCDSLENAQSHKSLHYDPRKLMQRGQFHAMVLKRAEMMQRIHVLRNQRHVAVDAYAQRKSLQTKHGTVAKGRCATARATRTAASTAARTEPGKSRTAASRTTRQMTEATWRCCRTLSA